MLKMRVLKKRSGGISISLNVAEVPSEADAFVFEWRRQTALALVQASSPHAAADVARKFCTGALVAFWKAHIRARGASWPVRKPVTTSLKGFQPLSDEIGRQAAALPLHEAGYALGQLYTSLLPAELRKTLGAYYTPPPLVERLIGLATDAGIDWTTARVIDPACGGAAFLAPLAPKLLEFSRGHSPEQRLERLEARLVGIEVDPFAAWMSQVLLDVALLDLCLVAGRAARPSVVASDALKMPRDELGLFDIVIGNPPYGKVTLDAELRAKFRRSLFGHANLYGLFTDLALTLLKSGGVIAYVTPTSFLGGEYFKHLRALLTARAPLANAEFVRDRDGVFDGVLQETMLAVFRERTAARSRVSVSLLHPRPSITSVKPEAIGTAKLNGKPGGPWFLPRAREQAQLIAKLDQMPHRLADYQFTVSTGQLVWNRHKTQLRQMQRDDCYPIIWAEAITSNGTFSFQAAKRSHLPFLKIDGDQDYLVNHEPCVLVQRTTAKEQKRRLIAAVVPNFFVLEYPGFLVENHLNMILSSASRGSTALNTIAALLNSRVVDCAFRCISGSVAVSAYELNSLPLPNPVEMSRLQKLVVSDASKEEVDLQIATFYSASNA